MQWTTKQQQVIEGKGSNMLVSAAAGSGKTAVLVERIKRLIIEEKVDVRELLVVTFTRAAAAEMKEKIVAAITKAADEEGADVAYLRKQLEALPRANISTFDSFAIDIIRKYFYIIGIAPELSIMDDAEGKIMKREAMDEVFEKLYEDADPAVLSFFDAYMRSSRDDALKEALINTYDKARNMPGALDWLEQAIDIRAEDVNEEIQQEVCTAVEVAIKNFKRAAELLSIPGLEKRSGAAIKDAMLLSGILDDFKSGNITKATSELSEFKAELDFQHMTNAEKAASKTVKDDVTKLRDEASKSIGDLRGRYFAVTAMDESKYTQRSKAQAQTMLRMLRMFDQVFRRRKDEAEVMDFADGNHFAIEILGNEEVAAEYRKKFKYIFIDEYQDSNYLQEEMIARIKRDDNLFMVGDIKQSIYGFRQAEPDIFKRRYREYASTDNKSSVKIDLNANFRSKAGIISTVNDIFSKLMKGYDESAMLVEGAPYGGAQQYESELHIIESDSEDQQVDEEIAEMKHAEKEALLAAALIEENLGETIYDAKAGCERAVEKRDVVILLRSARGKAELYHKELAGRGIESYIEDDSGYFDTIEIATMVDMLQVIDNRKRDIPLLSLLRSGLFDFSADELLSIRREHPDGAFHKAFFAGADNCDLPPQTTHKIREVISFIDEWVFRQSYTQIADFVWQLADESGYYAYVGALPAGKQRQANIRALVEKAGTYSRSGEGSIYGFLKYVEAIDKNKIDNGQARISQESADVVRIMTIHKSKGLEFPIVILSGIGQTIKKETLGRYGVMHKDIGFALPYIDRKKHFLYHTSWEQAILERIRSDDMEEERRILYVACTRAMDKLIMVGSRRDKGGDSFLKMIEESADNSITSVHLYDIAALGKKAASSANDENRRERLRRLDASIKEQDRQDTADEVARKLGFVYTFADDATEKSKHAVSELNRVSQEHYAVPPTLKIPTFVAGTKKLDGAEVGTIMHLVMEHIDFSEALQAGDRKRYIEDQVRRMVDDAIMLPEEVDAVNIEKISAFFDSDIGKRVSTATDIKKESHFTIKHEHEGKTMLVQGIIDCWFIERTDADERVVMLDYKTNYDTEGIEELYREQMELYKEAILKTTGKTVDECYLYLFKEDRATRM